MRVFGWFCAAILALGIIIVLTVLGGACDYGKDVFHEVASPQKVVSGYEWFVQQDKDIRGMDNQITTAQQAADSFKTSAGPREKWTHDDREEGSRLDSIVVGLKQSRQTMVNDYNARSDEKTRSFLKSSNLPEHYN